MSRIVLCGADDHEMNLIEQKAREHGLQVMLATVNGKRVTPRNAYQADNHVLSQLKGEQLICVECDVLYKHGAWPDDVIMIDHHTRDGSSHLHNVGNVFAAYPPELCWQASSLGQFFGLLGLAPDARDRIIAATDHCFHDAVQGNCPGVNPSDVVEMKLREWQLSDQALAEHKIQIANSPVVYIGGHPVVLYPRIHRGFYTQRYLGSVLAAAHFPQWTIIISRPEKKTEEYRFHLRGPSIPDSLVKVFREEWGPKHGLYHFYDESVRGYCGGYYRPKQHVDLYGWFDVRVFLTV